MVPLQICFILIVFLGVVDLSLGLQLKFHRGITATAAFNNLIQQKKVYGEISSSHTCGRYLSAMKMSTKSSDIKESMVKTKPEGIFNMIGESSKFIVSGAATIVLYSTESWLPLYYILMSIVSSFAIYCCVSILLTNDLCCSPLL